MYRLSYRLNSGDDHAVGVSLGEVSHDVCFVSYRQLAVWRSVVTVLVTAKRRTLCSRCVFVCLML